MGKFWRWLVVLVVLALVAGACGDDDDDDDAGSDGTAAAGEGDTTSSSAASAGTTASTAGATTTTAAPDDEPVQGGEAVVLVWNEVRGLDPNVNSPTSGASGLRDYALYGALVVYDVEANEMRPVMAESFESDATSTIWTLTIHDGITFSDGSPYDADAVKTNWERIQDPNVASPGRGFALSVASMTVTDPLTLEITLVSPNSVFDRLVGRTTLNYIASAEAISAGHDLANDPIGAGPFLLDEWIRDSHITMVRNPDWFDAPRPYLDQLTMRLINDEAQRIDTFSTGDGDAFYTIVEPSVTAGEEAGGTFAGLPVATGLTMSFNLAAPPFDDLRMRQAVTMAVDRDVLMEVADGPGSAGAQNFAPEGVPWFTEDAALPDVDIDAAQALIDEYLAEEGVDSVTIRLLSGQAPRNTTIAEFFQTSLNQLNGIVVETTPLDQPTLIQRNFAHDFEMSVWGYPTTNPDPDLYQGVYGGLPSNPTSYNNPEVNALFDEARNTADVDDRTALYQELITVLAEDSAFIPPLPARQGFVQAEGFHIGELFLDGMVQWDTTWIEA